MKIRYTKRFSKDLDGIIHDADLKKGTPEGVSLGCPMLYALCFSSALEPRPSALNSSALAPNFPRPCLPRHLHIQGASLGNNYSDTRGL